MCSRESRHDVNARKKEWFVDAECRPSKGDSWACLGCNLAPWHRGLDRIIQVVGHSLPFDEESGLQDHDRRPRVHGMLLLHTVFSNP